MGFSVSLKLLHTDSSTWPTRSQTNRAVCLESSHVAKSMKKAGIHQVCTAEDMKSDLLTEVFTWTTWSWTNALCVWNTAGLWCSTPPSTGCTRFSLIIYCGFCDFVNQGCTICGLRVMWLQNSTELTTKSASSNLFLLKRGSQNERWGWTK